MTSLATRAPRTSLFLRLRDQLAAGAALAGAYALAGALALCGLALLCLLRAAPFLVFLAGALLMFRWTGVL